MSLKPEFWVDHRRQSAGEAGPAPRGVGRSTARRAKGSDEHVGNCFVERYRIGRQAAKVALDAFASGSADFADYLIAALDREAGCETTLTFDKTAAKIRGFSLLST